VLWSHDVASDTGTKVPTWGFSGSPLVVNELVIVAASGTLAAYERATGKRQWVGPPADSYSSPHLVTIGGVPQVLLMTDGGVTSVSPADGTRLWKHAWDAGVTIVQPAVISDGQVLISVTGATGGIGLRRLAVARGAGGWSATEVWTTNALKPYFNDFVVHEGHAYGFDGSILACVDLNDGRRTWKGGRYGNGQLVLLADQGLLLVVSEEGELALVKATPSQFTEIARRPGIEGKTWNHPVVVGDTLLLRNGQEMAAFRLVLAPSK
jgi:outer membrane protein assembly factor BamB